MSLSLITPPDSEPISRTEAKKHIRVVLADEDAQIDAMIQAAREWAENRTGRQLLTATWAWTFDWFPCSGILTVPKPPLQAVTKIEYVDSAGVLQTWGSANYIVDAPSGPTAPSGRITPAYGQTWPVTRDVINAVTVTFTAGYGDDADAVPMTIREELLLRIGSMYEHREDTLADQFGQGVMELPGGSSRLAAFVVRPLQAERLEAGR